jgi:hypothetical protein
LFCDSIYIDFDAQQLTCGTIVIYGHGNEFHFFVLSLSLSPESMHDRSNDGNEPFIEHTLGKHDSFMLITRF